MEKKANWFKLQKRKDKIIVNSSVDDECQFLCCFLDYALSAGFLCSRPPSSSPTPEIHASLLELRGMKTFANNFTCCWSNSFLVPLGSSRSNGTTIFKAAVNDSKADGKFCSYEYISACRPMSSACWTDGVEENSESADEWVVIVLVLINLMEWNTKVVIVESLKLHIIFVFQISLKFSKKFQTLLKIFKIHGKVLKFPKKI